MFISKAYRPIKKSKLFLIDIVTSGITQTKTQKTFTCKEPILIISELVTIHENIK